MRSTARGMTLIEMAVASAIMGVVLVAIGSVMVVAARMTPTPASAEVRTNASSSALALITADLSRATGVLSANARSIRFTATDRGGDGVDDEITISWDGEKLSEVTRRINSEPTVTLADSVLDFSLAYVAGSVTTTSTGPPAEGPEEVFYVDDAPTGGTTFPLNAGAWVTLGLTPELPKDATAWRLTRARVSLSRSGTATGTTSVSVIGLSISPLNFGATLASATRAESEYATSFGWHEFAWASMATLPPGGSVAVRIADGAPATIVIAGKVVSNANSNAGALELSNTAIADSGAFRSSKPASAVLWDTDYDGSLKIVVYGRVTRPTTITTATATLDAVRVSLRTTGAPAGVGEARILRRPAFVNIN